MQFDQNNLYFGSEDVVFNVRLFIYTPIKTRHWKFGFGRQGNGDPTN
jgi:hypothetical protein